MKKNISRIIPMLCLTLALVCPAYASDHSTEGTLSAPGQASQGTLSAPAQASQGTLSAPAQASQGTISAPAQTSEGTLSAPAQTSEGTLSAPAQVITPAVPQEEGTLSVPNHPVSNPVERKIFIGDSRTVDMMNATQAEGVWSCKVSMGYDWMVSEGVPAIEPYIDANTAIIILLGVNDPGNIAGYITYTNQKAAEWAALGATTYYVSVGPVTADPYVTNADIEAFNAALQANLIGVNYIDIYTYLTTNGFSTVDGTHYPDDISIAIYNYIISNLRGNRTGIWG